MGGGGPLISVEMGGSYPSHAVPTNDIIADLKSNVEAYGLTSVVHIIEGFTTDAAVDAAVNRILDGRTIGLLFLDADGNVERDFEFYRGRLSRGRASPGEADYDQGVGRSGGCFRLCRKPWSLPLGNLGWAVLGVGAAARLAFTPLRDLAGSAG